MLPPDGWQLEAEMYSPATNKNLFAALIVMSTPGKPAIGKVAARPLFHAATLLR
jgi:hypothetical protein